MKTTVIVPTYNERENIERLVRSLLALPGEINTIIVDDGSPDGTGSIADALAEEYPSRVEVIHRSGKLGLGTAYIAGFRRALAGDSGLICTMDADFSHPPATIPEMVAKAAASYDLVIGSRYVPGGHTVGCTPPRIALSWGANAFARVLLGLRAHDTTAGFRCYRRAVLEKAPLDQILSNGYSFLIEMLYHVQRQGWKVGEVPITFENRREGTSKISKSEITKALATVLRLFGQRLKYLGRKVPPAC